MSSVGGPSAALTAERHACGSPLYRLNDGRLFCVGCSRTVDGDEK